jgi:hypothetical protein
MVKSLGKKRSRVHDDFKLDASGTREDRIIAFAALLVLALRFTASTRRYFSAVSQAA